jgi:hypothetical protein
MDHCAILYEGVHYDGFDNQKLNTLGVFTHAPERADGKG